MTLAQRMKAFEKDAPAEKQPAASAAQQSSIKDRMNALQKDAQKEARRTAVAQSSRKAPAPR